MAGRAGVKAALDGVSGVMMGFARSQEGPYHCQVIQVPLEEVANQEKALPLEWINEAGNGVTQAFIDYALP